MIRRLHAFARQRAGVGPYLRAPGAGHVAPVVPASALLWALLVADVVRDGAFRAVEALVRSRARRVLGIRSGFGDDTVAYFTGRLDVRAMRTAPVTAVRQAKRRGGVDEVPAIGLTLDGTTVGRCPTVRCRWCHPIAVPATTETGAARAVGDGLYAIVLFLHAAGDRGLHALVRLKANVPTLWAAAQARVGGQPPTLTVEARGDRIELWDADDFDPWTDLRWSSARVLRYRHHHPDSLLVHGLLVALTLTLERLFRLRFLHRGARPPLAAMALLRRFRLALGAAAPDTG